MREYWVYMLRCIDGTYYIGITNDPVTRIAEHEAGVNPHCYTYGRRPVSVMHLACFPTALDALMYERRLKRMRHAQKEEFLAQHGHPKWPGV